MSGDISLLSAIVGGACSCSSAFTCTLTIDRYGFFIWIALLMYMFKLLSVICDTYFAPCLEAIVRKLDMSADVAGATFMAAGSSAPELSTALLATFVIRSEGGVGTIIGSAIFNILVIIGMTGLIACQERDLPIDWYPLTRDTSFYMLAIGELLWVLNDEVVVWYEALVMVASYGLYLLYMKCNFWIKVKLGLCPPVEKEVIFEPQDDLWHCIAETEVAILTVPELSAKETGFMLSPAEQFYVYQELDGPDDILYLRLNDGRGWVFDRMPGSDPDDVNSYNVLRDKANHDRKMALKEQKKRSGLGSPTSSGGGKHMSWSYGEGEPLSPSGRSDDARPVLLGKATMGGNDRPQSPQAGGSSPSRALDVSHGSRGSTPKGSNSGEAANLSKVQSRLNEFIGRIKVQPHGVMGAQLSMDMTMMPGASYPDSDTVALDPAGLDHIRERGPDGAGGTAGTIYKWLGIQNDAAFPVDIKKAIKAPLAAAFHGYPNDKQVIHVVAPDFREERYDDGKHEVAVRDLAVAYHNVLVSFAESGFPNIRLLPLSEDLLAGDYSQDMADMTLVALCAAYRQLDSRARRRVDRAESLELCIFMEADFEEYKKAFEAGAPPEEVLPDISRADSLGLAQLNNDDASEDPELGGLRGAREHQADAFDFLLQDPISLCWDRSALLCRLTPEDHSWTFFAFSIFSIGVCSFVMVDAVDRLGCTFSVEPFWMGLLFLSAGTSVPDALSSIAVAKQGHGDMAIANALGSNIFDIMLGLGIPWLIANILQQEVRFPGSRDVLIEGITTLLIFLMFFLFVLVLNKWKMNRLMGCLLLFLYGMYILYYICRMATSPPS